MTACSIEGCDREATRTARTLCEMHYYRIRRTGTAAPRPRKPKPTPKPPRPRPGTVPCAADGCDSMATRGRWCRMHRARIERNGDPYRVTPSAERNLATRERNRNWTGEHASYEAVHQRLSRERGRAAERVCVDCGRRAAQWSYTHGGGPGQREGEQGAYSVDLSDYEPRCVPCHKRYDLARITQEEA